LATEVDHIIPKAKGGTDDPSNLAAINAGCHRRKTLRDRGAEPKAKRTTGADGWPIE
jgi:5-methylcytosine-specific restriction protein A